MGGEGATALACGVDIGGTKIAGGLVDADGTVLARDRVDSPRDADAISAAVAALVQRLVGDQPIAAVGVGAAGFVDRTRSRVLMAPNLPWRDADLRHDLEQRLGLPVAIENDGNAAAWGEFRYGAGRDIDDLLLLTVGTGVGGGVVLDGRLYRGAYGVAGEVGHLRVVPNGVRCGCGNRGCLESYASGTALERRARERAGAGEPGSEAILARVAGDPAAIGGRLVTELAREGDPFATSLLAEVGHWLGEGIASLAAVLDPAVVVVGGGVSAAGDLLLGPVREAFADHLTGRAHRPLAEIRPAELGNLAGLIGAADLARRE